MASKFVLKRKYYAVPVNQTEKEGLSNLAKLGISAGIGLLGGALTWGAAKITCRALNDELIRGIGMETTDRDKKLREIILNKFKDKHGQVNYAEAPGFGNACAIPGLSKEFIMWWKSLPDDEKKQYYECGDPLVVAIIKVVDAGVKPDTPIIIADPTFVSPSVIGHEIGHTKFQDPNDDSVNSVIKVAHKIHIGQLGGLPLAILGGVTSAKLGWGSGKSLLAMLGLTTLNNAGNALRESGASYESIKELRAAGATEEEIEKYKKNLMKAGGTYATNIAANMGALMVGRALGKAFKLRELMK